MGPPYPAGLCTSGPPAKPCTKQFVDPVRPRPGDLCAFWAKTQANHAILNKQHLYRNKKGQLKIIHRCKLGARC